MFSALGIWSVCYKGDMQETHRFTNDMGGGQPFSKSILSTGEAQVNQQGNSCLGGVHRGRDLQAESWKNRDTVGRQACKRSRKDI